MIFKDRIDAGRKLANALEKYKGKNVIVMAIPRGGVVLGAEIADHLEAPLGLIITRKITHPSSPEYAIGVVAVDGHTLYNEEEKNKLTNQWLEYAESKAREEAQRREQVYLFGKDSPTITGKVAILVDDGVATGLSFRLGIQELRHEQPKKIVAALPVAPRNTARLIRKEVDEAVILQEEESYLGAVGAYYVNFDQVSDDEVIRLVKKFDRSHR